MLWLPAVVVVLGVLGPVGYLVARALQAEAGAALGQLLRWRNLELLWNTVTLATGVLALTTLLAAPAAWVTARRDLPVRGLLTVLLIVPLAVPGYVLAYALLALGGSYGASYHLLGVAAPRLSGYTGALLALALTNYPYVLLSLRAGLLQMDPGQEEAARSLGHGPRAVAARIVVPQLMPAMLAGQLLVALHVVSDFGVVSLMGYPTLSYALYQSYAGFDLTGGAWIALVTMLLAAVLIAGEWWVTRNLRLHRAAIGAQRRTRGVELGRWRWAAAAAVFGLVLLATAAPVTVIAYWASQAQWSLVAADVVESVTDSVTAAAPAAVVATLLAAPVAWMSRRYPGRRTMLAERLAFAGYATPALAFALGLVVVSLTVLPWLYQSLVLLVYAYGLHFMAEAIGPIRASVMRASPRVEEAARSLGAGPVATLWRVTLPTLRPGLVVAAALVFISTMKELPLTMLLAPLGFQTLATNTWTYASEAMFAEAAPFALLIVVISCGFVGLLLRAEVRE